ncbi:5-oxoprolinase subunit PxpB [Anaeroselena agilis]|uniref:5-oxoprolinase subunit PxpB n=1 Tax=Anaeroselena agilis TaxID=3063788 RepID=A0ABU3NVY7_9FIRM|nr:5-oxoprolinase subunit PxpB [Selenomonadales bacterium 4137-cl]
MDEIRFLDAGEQGLVVEFGARIDPGINRRVHNAATLIAAARIPGILEVVPTYRSLLIYFDPLAISRRQLAESVRLLLEDTGGEAQTVTARVVEIPVAYGGEHGPDLAFVASHTGLSPEEVVAIHTSVPYLVYMLGFTPGFPYLGGMSERIAAPRLEQPRTAIPGGSVGIAGTQTGIYPVASPGGWRIIGRTPVKLFAPGAADPFLFAAGDYLQFKAVSAADYAAIAEQVASGVYEPVVRSATDKGGDAR